MHWFFDWIFHTPVTCRKCSSWRLQLVAMLRDTCFLYLRSLHFQVIFTSTQMCILIFVTSYLPKKLIGLKPRKGCVLEKRCVLLDSTSPEKISAFLVFLGHPKTCESHGEWRPSFVGKHHGTRHSCIARSQPGDPVGKGWRESWVVHLPMETPDKKCVFLDLNLPWIRMFETKSILESENLEEN